MKLLSVNVSLPKTVVINGHPVLTGIYKEPVGGTVALGKLGLEGDGQADLTVHGGEYQAIYSYPFEHYAYWERVLERPPFEHGTFGENLTVTEMLETEVCIGDVYRIGTATVQVTMPRIPCFKFGHKIGKPTILKEFLHSGRSGFYQRVVEEGMVSPGDTFELVSKDPRRVTVRDTLGMQKFDEGDRESLEKALSIEALGAYARRDLMARLERMM